MNLSTAADRMRHVTLRIRVPRLLDKHLKRLRAGQKPSEHDVQKCANIFEDYYQLLCRLHRTRDNKQFPDEDRVHFYINAVKLTALGHPQHGGWPFRAGIRCTILNGLKHRNAQGDVAWNLFCSIMPALVSDDTEYAVQAYKKLQPLDPQLARISVKWVERAATDYQEFNKYDLERFRAAVR